MLLKPTKKLFMLTLLVLTCATCLFAQAEEIPSGATGRIAGKVIDGLNGEGVYGAVVQVMGTSPAKYGLSDLDGKYAIEDAPAGKLELRVKMSGYNQTKDKVTVVAGQTIKYNPTLTSGTEEVIVQGRQVSDTAAALLSVRKKAPVAQDAISAEEISKSPDSDVGDAAKRVTGVSIVDGDIFIRGLSERYSSVLFSDSAIASPDPDRRIIPLEIFPTSLIDNLTIIKAYSPELPGDFGGGVVKINPKDFPEERTLKISGSLSYKHGVTFQDFQTYQGGDWDWLGVDDGTREVPDGLVPVEDFNIYTDEELESITKSLNNVYTPETKKAPIGGGVSVSYGDTYEKNGLKFGVNLSGLYKAGYKAEEGKVTDYSSDLTIDKDYDKSKSTFETTKGLLGTFALLKNKQQVKLTSFYSHVSEDSTQTLEGPNEDITVDIKEYDLRFIEQGIWFSQLAGSHFFANANNLELNYRVNFSWAIRDEPDRRQVQLRMNEATGEFYLDLPSAVRRTYSKSEEFVYGLDNLSFTMPFRQWNGLQSKVTIGTGAVYRDRDTEIRRIWLDGDQGQTNRTDPIEDDLTDDNVDSSPSGDQYIFEEQNFPGDIARASQLTVNGYINFDLPLMPNLRSSFGGRYEYVYSQYEEFKNEVPDGIKENESVDNNFKPHNILGALNLTHILNSDMNIRYALSKTISRPDFREISEVAVDTVDSTTRLVGNTNLTQTEITSLDTRYEWFPSPRELIGVTLFYKYLKSPIEILEINNPSETVFQYKNANSAHNFGIELEARKALSQNIPFLRNLFFSMNFSLIFSRIDIDREPGFLYSNLERPLQGQSPYIINTSLSYENDKSGSVLTLSYNMAGRYIKRVGVYDGSLETGTPLGDVYREPFPKLDLVYKQKLGKKGGAIKFTYANILNPEIKDTQKIRNETVTLQSEKKGWGMSLGYSYSFW